MLGILPAEIRHELEDAMDSAAHPALLADVRALLLESLRQGGGES